MTHATKKIDYMKIRKDRFMIVSFGKDGKRRSYPGMGIIDAVKYMIAMETEGQTCFILPEPENRTYDPDFGVFSDMPDGPKEIFKVLKELDKAAVSHDAAEVNTHCHNPNVRR